MRKFFTTGALFLAVSLIPAALPTHAQSTPDAQTPPPAQDNGAMMAAKTPTTTVTGCIAAGKKDGTFKLTADDGTVYMLRSRNTNFAEHVGHTVTGRVLTGQGGANGAAPANSGDSSASGDANQNAPAEGSGAATKHAGMTHLMVRSMTMVSETCKAK